MTSVIRWLNQRWCSLVGTQLLGFFPGEYKRDGENVGLILMLFSMGNEHAVPLLPSPVLSRREKGDTPKPLFRFPHLWNPQTRGFHQDRIKSDRKVRYSHPSNGTRGPSTHQQLAAELQSLHRDVEEARPRVRSIFIMCHVSTFVIYFQAKFAYFWC